MITQKKTSRLSVEGGFIYKINFRMVIILIYSVQKNFDVAKKIPTFLGLTLTLSGYANIYLFFNPDR